MVDFQVTLVASVINLAKLLYTGLLQAIMCVLYKCICVYLCLRFSLRKTERFWSSVLHSVLVSLCFWKSTWNLASSWSLAIPIKSCSSLSNSKVIGKHRIWSFSVQFCYILEVVPNNWILKEACPAWAYCTVESGTGISQLWMPWMKERKCVPSFATNRPGSLSEETTLCRSRESDRWQKGSWAQVLEDSKDCKAVGLYSWIGNGPALLHKDQQ